MLHAGLAAGLVLIDHPFKSVRARRRDGRVFVAGRATAAAFLVLHAGLAAGLVLIDHPFKGVFARGVDGRVFAAGRAAAAAFLMLHAGFSAGRFLVNDPFKDMVARRRRIVFEHEAAQIAGIGRVAAGLTGRVGHDAVRLLMRG